MSFTKPTPVPSLSIRRCNPVIQTLFDGWAVVREWGRIGQSGTVREAWFETESAAIEAGAKVRKRKEKRGYRAVIVCGEKGHTDHD
jgi:predicted DNA-binding WGR domain protein